MEKKNKIKGGLAVGFVMVCGVVCLMLRGGGHADDRIVLEQSGTVVEDNRSLADEAEQDTTTENRTAEEKGIADEHVTDDAPDGVQMLCVHMCGAVVTEGVYYVPVGSRVTDGIAAAGGFSEAADTTYHNLAALLADGQKVYVPTREETTEVTVEERVSDTAADTSESKGSEGASEKRKVNLNTATLTELMTLSGIGEAKAKSILQYREKVGPFGRIEEIKNISGIGDAMFDRIKEDITVE
jgi:competence protein ComEA